jgi:DNA-directed RNA polymerase specialized sigma24 family protein
MADDRGLDMGALYVRHCDELLVFFVRRTSDTEVALDLWGETFAQALASRGRFRGATEEEAGAWLFGIARHQLARYYRRGSAERRAMTRLGIERPTINPDTEAEMNRPGNPGGLDLTRLSRSGSVLDGEQDHHQGPVLDFHQLRLPPCDTEGRGAVV